MRINDNTTDGAWSPVRSALTVAGHELADSVRSRRALVLLILYFLGALAATLLFVKVLHEVENRVESALGVTKSNRAGGATSSLWKNELFRDALVNLTGDKKLALELLSLPPLGVFYGWLSFAFAPLMVVLLSATRIADEVWSGSVRFVLFRTSRLAWCMGKFIGQACLLLAALLVSAAAAWFVGWVRLAAFDPGANAWAITFFAVKAWVYALAFLGLALGVSQMVTSPNMAAALSFVALVVMGIVGAVADHLAGGGWRRVWELVHLLTPGGHQMDLWRLDMAHSLPAAVFLLALAIAYMLIGHARFSRRDL